MLLVRYEFTYRIYEILIDKTINCGVPTMPWKNFCELNIV